MRSEIAKKILSETPEEVKDKVRDYGDEVKRRTNEIFEVAKNLSNEERSEAIFTYARTKWHRLNNDNASFRAVNEGFKIVEK